MPSRCGRPFHDSRLGSPEWFRVCRLRAYLFIYPYLSIYVYLYLYRYASIYLSIYLNLFIYLSMYVSKPEGLTWNPTISEPLGRSKCESAPW
jgi:hypothetical protein